jgi:hypothetical protein
MKGGRLSVVLAVLALLGVATAGRASTAGPTFVDPTVTTYDEAAPAGSTGRPSG